ncbi:hypothetical protein M2447_000749 [Ereboglobus sp. PH5-10]|uniref:hypothetical protein n=1 Tax=Ereboglobus sp. PH5-10 TaxID=2940629 RepID=UPI002406E28C|nr:hypothetical protein [Ereboglobus sp. PH5-10]MDF9826667.1 hypothetical protein [Ereboglobus sp. PH5-10]
MKTVRQFMIIMLATVLSAGALNARDISDYIKELDESPYPEMDKEYYLRHCIWFERGKHKTTNYARGEMLPVNTKVTLLYLSGSDMSIRVNETGKVVKVNNVINFSRKHMSTIARLMLSPKEVSVSGEFAESIRNGEPRLGMTKEEVVMTRGWPPAHKTDSLVRDKWMYWSSKLVVHTLEFEGEKLVKGRGIH